MVFITAKDGDVRGLFLKLVVNNLIKNIRCFFFHHIFDLKKCIWLLFLIDIHIINSYQLITVCPSNLNFTATLQSCYYSLASNLKDTKPTSLDFLTAPNFPRNLLYEFTM